jgi:hypothetical protein
MEYYLENLRTGEPHLLNPDRTLIGSADHSAIRTAEGGPFLAALIVNYDTGWTIHGLTDEEVYFKGQPLRVTQQVTPHGGDVLQIGTERFRFVVDADSALDSTPLDTGTDHPPGCFVYIRFPDGMEECRVVDHNLLFGRLRVCHVRSTDTKLSRLNALLAPHAGVWYVHALNKGVVGRNRRAVSGFARLEDGDELLIGPLVVRVELRQTSTIETPSAVDTGAEVLSRSDDSSMGTGVTDAPTVESSLQATPHDSSDISPAPTSIQVGGARLDQWLKAQSPEQGSQPGLSGWLGAQREKLKRFWLDTPETTTARALRTAGKPDEAFAVLDRAIRARPESPDLLRELYRLYDSVGLHDLCFRPLRQIEKLASARDGADTWVLETLARLCEKLGKQRPSMFDRAIHYWNKLERATGGSYHREKAATMANRTLSVAGYNKMSGDDD